MTILLRAALFTCALIAASAAAQEYPSKSVSIVVGFAAGGAIDTTARILGQKLAENLGKPVVIDGRPGDSGNIGARFVAKAPNDGHTLLMGLMGALTTHSMNATLMQGQTGYDLDRDFAAISIVGSLPLVLVVNSYLPANTVPELITLAKSRPGQLAFGSSGNGSIEHVAAEMFGRQANIKILHVPYRGAAPAMVDLMGGQIQAIMTTTTTAINNLKGGRLKPLMVATPERLITLPDVKTGRESGLPGFEVASTYGMLAPAGTPPAIVARLNREFTNIVATPDVKARFAQLGIEPAAMSPEESARRIRAELDKWNKVIRDANIKME
ncbi:MAG: tripartite tricarboxylate transporter substrate binding protein [Betaproteobacteria bacterium]|nr:tripartite tricarboxylate transporter substrate binding protein [Betaproteobacteria bacterium]